MRFAAVFIFAAVALQLLSSTTAAAADDNNRECLVGIGVLSTSSHFERREVVRNTWFKYPSVLNKKACVVFVIGLPADKSVMAKLQKEMETKKDIVLTDTQEGWEKLTWQALRMHEHFANKAHWVVKTDDDTMIRVDRLVEYVEQDPTMKSIRSGNKMAYVGWKVNGAPTHRQGRYMLTPQEYALEELPEYMSGPAYMVSGVVSDAIVDMKQAGKLKMLKLEDIALSLWVQDLRAAGKSIEVVDNRSFYKIRTCHDMAFSVLLEEGRPLMLDADGVAKAMKEIVENDRQKKMKVCPYETTMEAIQDRIKREKEAEENAAKKASSSSSKAPAPAPAPAPAQKKQETSKATSSSEKPKSKSKSKDVKVVLYDDPRGFHPYFMPGQQKCNGVPGVCDYVLTQDKDAMSSADGVVFLGDNEIYGHNGDRKLPERAGSAPWMFVFREALHKFPSVAWSKYDHSITYRADDYTTYSYMEDLDEFLAQARSSLAAKKVSFPSTGIAPVAYVGLRCGDRPSDNARKERTALVETLGKSVLIDSYGVCLRNISWPEGHDRDKFFVMQQHKFCIAFENSFDSDYVTEKVFDCLRAGAIPIYSGPANAAKFIPGGRNSALFVSDYTSVEELGKHIQMIDRSESLWKKYTDWIRKVPDDWNKFMKQIQNKDVRCRLCEKLYKDRDSSADEKKKK